MKINQRQWISVAAAAVLLVSVLIANWFLNLYQPAGTAANTEYLSRQSTRFVIVWLVILGLILTLALVAGIRKNTRAMYLGLSVILYQILAMFTMINVFSRYWYVLPSALLFSALMMYYLVHKPVGRELLLFAVTSGICVGVMRLNMNMM